MQRERVPRLARANTTGADGRAPLPKTSVKRAGPSGKPYDPWASDSEDDSVVVPPRRKLPVKSAAKNESRATVKGESERTGLEAPSRPNPLLAHQSSSRKTRSVGQKGSADASPRESARSPSQPNPLLPSSRSPSMSRQATEASMTPRGARDRPSTRKRDGSPRTPETTDPAMYLQSLLETPTTTASGTTETEQSPFSPPETSPCTRSEMRKKAFNRTLSRLNSDEEGLDKAPKVRQTTRTRQEPRKSAEEKPRGRSQPTRRTELKAASDAAGGGVPVATKAKKVVTKPRKTTKPEERPRPKMLGASQESLELDAADEDLSRTNELMTTFGEARDETFSFINETVPKVLDTPLQSSPTFEVESQRSAFGHKVFSFSGEEPSIKMESGWSSGNLQDPAPAFAAYEFQKPLGKLDGSAFKDGQAQTPNTNVRLPRLAELPRQVSRKSCKATDRMSGFPVPEYADVMRVLQAQIVLGHSWSSDAPVRSVVLALLRWFAPYLALLCLALPAAVLGLKSEAALAVSPALLLLAPLQQLRLRRWDARLLGAVDRAALGDACDQLRAPLGWGDDGQVFSANLNAAMQALSLPPGELLMPPARGQGPLAWKRHLLCASCALAPLALWLLRDQLPAAAEVPLLVFCSLVVLVAACRPGKELGRADLVDRRLEALEAAFNALLDTLRPLLPSARPSRSCQVVKGPPGRFSVRMITGERWTLRGSLTILQEQCGLLVSCPLGAFQLAADGLEGAMQLELGQRAAGDADGATVSPGPRQANGWAASLGMRFAREPSERARRDDDLASVSTASTLTRAKSQVDEASLNLVLNMISALNRRAAEPLEVFFADRGAPLAPPKVSYDEPAIVLALAEDQLSCFGSDSGAPARRRRRCCLQKGSAAVK
ncbi:unnamed protein product, partial [Effrenium voratum]